jgi:pilus assembly protein CpaB
MPILRGEPILASKLAAIGQQGGLSSVLKEGKRAVTVKVNEVVGVAGFALPGNYVDVMAYLPDRDNDPVSKIVLERIQVLAVAQDIANTENKPRVVSAVTLEVTPQEAEIIDLARSVGSLSLVLRSQMDMASVVTSGSRKVDLLQKTAPQPALFKALSTEPKPADGPRSVTSGLTKPASLNQPSKTNAKMEVIRGMTRSLESTY